MNIYELYDNDKLVVTFEAEGHVRDFGLPDSTNLFVLLMNGMFELHHNHKQNDVLRGLANSFFAEKW
jgi:hypothetical protein